MKSGIKITLLTLIIFVLSFPKIEPVIDPGIDPPLLWAYNFFLDEGIHSGTEILFTHGPLAFLIAPLPMGNNLLLGILLISLIHILFIYSFLRTLALARPDHWWQLSPLVLLLTVSLGTEYLIIGISACALVMHSMSNNKYWLLCASLFAAFGLFVKAYIGIMAIINVMSYAGALFLFSKRWREAFIAGLGMAASFGLLWICTNGSLEGSGKFLKATIEFSKDNSSASSLYPENNWALLGGAIWLAAVLPFAMREKKAWMFYVAFALPVFAGWKHGMTREDIYHVEGFFYYLVMVFLLLCVISEKLSRFHVAIALGSLLLFHMNIKNCENYRESSFSFAGPANFAEVFFGYNTLLKESEAGTAKRMEPLKLDKKMKDAMGSAYVDVYPWNFSYIPANGLNWRPRPVLQSYATYTHWLDEQNANHFRSSRAPKHILWELVGDRWGGEFGSIDNRYVLNDEPRTILSILDRYKLTMKSNKILLFTRDDGDHLGGTESLSKDTARWNTWVKVPEQEGILRVKARIRGKVLRFLKTQLYKDGSFHIEYKLDNGEIKKYRIVPAMATEGIWVNPLVLHPSMNHTEPVVKEIRFSCSNEKLMKKEIAIEWTITRVNGEGSSFALFGKTSRLENDTSTLMSRYGFESPAEKEWWADNKFISAKNAHTGTASFLMGDDLTYSATFTKPLSELNGGRSILVTASVWGMYPAKTREASLVISVEENGKAVVWEAVPFSSFISSKGEWLPVSITRKVNGAYGRAAVLKVYVMCAGKGLLLLDDMEVVARPMPAE